MLIGTIDFYLFIPLSLTFDLGVGSQGQHKAKLTGFIFSHTVQPIRMNFDMVLKQVKLNILILLLNEIIEIREIIVALLTA